MPDDVEGIGSATVGGRGVRRETTFKSGSLASSLALLSLKTGQNIMYKMRRSDEDKEDEMGMS